jgi:Uma2 family endonuclease
LQIADQLRIAEVGIDSQRDDGIVVVVSKAEPLGRAATYQDLCEVPDHVIAEILKGELWVSPRPVPRHAHVLSTLTAELLPPFQHGRGGPGGWRLLVEAELHLAGDVLVPDLAGWRASRASTLMERPHISLRPDWVCEILSKSTETIDRDLKMQIYARQQVGHLWFVDPRKKTLEVFQLTAGDWVPIQVSNDDAVVAAEPFDAVPFPLSRLWV